MWLFKRIPGGVLLAKRTTYVSSSRCKRMQRRSHNITSDTHTVLVFWWMFLPRSCSEKLWCDHPVTSAPQEHPFNRWPSQLSFPCKRLCASVSPAGTACPCHANIKECPHVHFVWQDITPVPINRSHLILPPTATGKEPTKDFCLGLRCLETAFYWRWGWNFQTF